ncbi:MAG: polysaccharide biosynthesis protein [Geobacter sp.]|nr:MAG: polysaccharide biosynthesis protein [Geobacter sp.]
MSRIEKALEKAAQLRNTTTTVVEQITNYPENSNYSSQTVSRTLDIKPSSRLLTTIIDPHSPVSEQYRKLKTHLVKLTQKDGFQNILMVTSTVSREGKSITALNLAISLAQEFDHTVLLVDADLRRPSIHQYLEFEPEIGLSDCLLDGIDIGEAIVRTGIGKLSVIPAGKEVPNPLELFSSKKMQDLVKEMKHRYHDRYVIFDTPPLLPFAETRSLGHLVDGIVFVVKEGEASQADIREAIDAVKGCRILGVVLNESSDSVDDNRYGEYSYYMNYAKDKAAASS